MKAGIWIACFLGLFASPAPAQIVDEVPRQTVVIWLALVDRGEFKESWKKASPFFQKAISEEDWVTKIRKSRKNLGPLKKREFIRGRFMKDPEGQPAGEYFALEFRTEFDKSKITEWVVSMRDETGLWQVSSYAISSLTPQPAP